MNLLSCFSLLLIMWVLSNTLFSAIIDARSEPPIPVPSISEQFFVAERIPSSQFLVKMEAEPPGPGTSTMQRIFSLCSLFHTTMYFLWFVHYLLICGLTCLPCPGSQSKLKFETRLKYIDFCSWHFLDNTFLLCLVADNAV